MDEQNGRGEKAEKGKMETMNISLPKELADFVAKRVEGQFGNRSEYIRHLVREDAEKRTRFEQLIREGLDETGATEVTPEFWEAMKARVAERLKQRKSA